MCSNLKLSFIKGKELFMYVELAKNRQLETERLILRPITMSDASDMFEYASDKETTHHVFPTHKTLKETEWVIANLFMRAPLGHFAIEEKKDTKMIGTCDIRPDEASQSVELAYALNKNYWGKGLATEVVRKLVDVSIINLKAVRVWAAHDIDNRASGRVMEKVGMKKEGVLRLRQNLCNELRDTAIWSYLATQNIDS